MIKHILPLIPAHDIYIEPFAGSAVVFFSKQLAYSSILNDKNDNIVNFYQVAKKYPDNLIQECECVIASESLFNQYKQCLQDKEAEPFAKAVAFWAVNVLESHIGRSNMAFELCKNVSHPNNRLSLNILNMKEYLSTYINLLNYCQITNRDVLDVFKLTKNAKNAFIYLDPPYINTAQGSHYAAYTEADYVALLTELETTSHKFMLSSYPNDILQQFIDRNNWHVNSYTKLITAGGVKAGSVRKNTKTELLVMNYKQNNLFNQ